MRTKNQISLKRKTLYGIMLLGVLLSAFGGGNLPSARAQVAPTDIPRQDVTLIPGTVSVDQAMQNAIVLTLENAYSVLTPDIRYFATTDVRKVGNWAFVSVIGLIQFDESVGWFLEDGAWFGLVLLQNNGQSNWNGATQGTMEFSNLLQVVPNEIIDLAGKQNIDPLSRQPDIGLQNSYIFPWQAGTMMLYGSYGVHANGFAGVVSGWKAVDMMSDGNTGAGHAPNRLLAASGGTIDYKCTDANNVAIRLGSFFYTHLVNNSNLYTGNTFNQGTELGQLKTGTYGTPGVGCGYANQTSGWFHVHWGFPNADLNVENWTLSISTQNWTNGSITVSPGNGWILAGSGSPPNPPTLLTPGEGQTLTSRSVHYTWQSPSATNQNGYTFRLSTNSNPDTQPWLVDTGLGNEYSSYDYNFNADGTYYWHMRTWNTSNQASDWVTRLFVINTSGGGGNNPPAGFTWCADEDGHCSFSGTADVVYGAVNSFTSPLSFTNGTDCNNGIFGDPIGGTRKACYSKLTDPVPSGNLHVEYFNDRNLGSRCYDGYENSTYVFKNWGSGSPASGCNSDNFSARFTGTYNFPGGNYSFHCQHDDGCRIYIDGELKLDAWWDSAFTGHDWGGQLSGDDKVVTIEFYDSSGDARLEAFWSGAGFLSSGPDCTPGEWCGQYFGNKDLAGTPAVRRNEGNININYTWNDSGIGFGLPNDNFSVRWERNVYFAAGHYRFHIKTDDGGRLWVNNNLVIDQWQDQDATEYIVELDLGAAEIPLKFEYYENSGGAVAQIGWEALQVYLPPSAGFDTSPQGGTAPFTTALHIIDMSNITDCSWNYGDGQTSTTCTQLHDHVYNSSGSYTVSLTVSGPGGEDSMTRMDYITVPYRIYLPLAIR